MRRTVYVRHRYDGWIGVGIGAGLRLRFRDQLAAEVALAQLLGRGRMTLPNTVEVELER